MRTLRHSAYFLLSVGLATWILLLVINVKTFELPYQVNQNDLDSNTEFREAVNAWNYAAKTWNVSELFTVSDQKHSIYISKYFALISKLFDGSVSGNSYRIGSLCIVSSRPQSAVVYMHELGHCLGLKHTDDKNSLMAGRPEKPDKVIFTKEIMEKITELTPLRVSQDL